MKNWKYVLPTTLGIIIFALVVCSASLEKPTERAILLTPTSFSDLGTVPAPPYDRALDGTWEPPYDLSLGTVTPMATWHPDKLTAVQNWIDTQTPYPPATLTAFFATEYAMYFTATSTPTATPFLECVEVTWDKGTIYAGLNIREDDTMHNYGNKLGFLYKGNIFRPLAVVENGEGVWAQYSDNPPEGGWIAMSLGTKVYAVPVVCPK